MLVEAADLAGIHWIVPCAGRDLRNTRTNIVTYDRAREHRAPLVENPHHIPVTDAPRRRVVGIDGDRLTTTHFGCSTHFAVVVLTVQPGCGLVRKQMERINRNAFADRWLFNRL